MNTRHTLLLLPLLLWAPLTLASSTYRCGSQLVSVQATTSEVQSKCGTPASSSLLGFKEVVDEYGFRNEVQVEEWIYGPNSGMFHYLRFEGNRLQRIDSKRGQ